MLQQDPGIMDQFGVDPAPIRVPGSIKSKVVVSFIDDSFNLVGCSCGNTLHSLQTCFVPQEWLGLVEESLLTCVAPNIIHVGGIFSLNHRDYHSLHNAF